MNDNHSPDDPAEQIKLTREKIRAIENSAIKNKRHPTGRIRCSFCNKTASEVGGLCQSDNSASICLECAKSAVHMLESEKIDD